MIKIIKKEKSDPADELFRMEFFCDSEADVALLPTQNDPKNDNKCATGSLAFVLDTDEGRGRIRILASSGKWREVGA